MYFIKDGYQENTLANSFDESKNDVCEKFWTAQRLETAAFYQHHVYSYAAKIFENKNYKSIVDVGCGPAVKTGKFFADIADEICLIDQISIQQVALANISKGSFISENLEKPISSNLKKYDMVLCSDVVEHLVNPVPCLCLLKSLVSDNGTIIISTPERDNLRGVKCMKSMHKAHVREWNFHEFHAFIKSLGFTIKNHVVMPQHRLSMFEESRFKLTRGLHNKKKYLSCQVVICRT